MADRPRHRLRLGAFAVALVVSVGAAALLVVSVQQRDDAHAELAAAQAALRTERAARSSSAKALAGVLRVLQPIRSQLPTITPAATAIAKLDEQDLETVRGAVQAGLAGDLDGYNAAADRRAALGPGHDASLEQLRQQANAVITALDQLRG